ncbi:hypothetical protein [Consotaella aegiceratis]|uniref:hypothetical protein n=1 Tax=Consotaella aegiceratis TaxID=3097961 RepID=UPI002F40C940
MPEYAFPDDRAEMATLDTSIYTHAWFDGSEWDLVTYNATLAAADTQQALSVQSSDDATKMWAREHDGVLNTEWFGVAVANNSTAGGKNSPFLQAAFDMQALVGFKLWTPRTSVPLEFDGSGTLTARGAAIAVRHQMSTWECDAFLEWTSSTGVFFDLAPSDPEQSALIAPEWKIRRAYASVMPNNEDDYSGSQFMIATRVINAKFKIRTDDFFRHYTTYGCTRWDTGNCEVYGNTLWPKNKAVKGSWFICHDGYVFNDGTRRPAANMRHPGSEVTANDATRKNMEVGILIRDMDGFWSDVSSYVGLAKVADFRFIPSAPEAVLTNIILDGFKDGGPGRRVIDEEVVPSTTDNIVEFTEPSDGYMTGTCRAIEIRGILSGAAGSGVRLNIANLSDIKISGIIKACTAYGINWLKGSRLNVAGLCCYGNLAGDINNPDGRTLYGADAAMTDKSATIASFATFKVPALQDRFIITGTNALQTINGWWDRRVITLVHEGAQLVRTTGNLRPEGGVEYQANSGDVSMWIYSASQSAWLQIAKSSN